MLVDGDTMALAQGRFAQLVVGVGAGGIVGGSVGGMRNGDRDCEVGDVRRCGLAQGLYSMDSF